jgi:hypothetical protein
MAAIMLIFFWSKKPFFRHLFNYISFFIGTAGAAAAAAAKNVDQIWNENQNKSKFLPLSLSSNFFIPLLPVASHNHNHR